MPEKAGVHLQQFIERINNQYKGEVAQFGGSFDALRIKRVRSGALSLDLALGGGWPFGRCIILAGEYSTGKTLLALKAMREIEEIDHATHLHKSLLPKGTKFTPGSALFVDMEGTFDAQWAEDNGVNLAQHVVTRPEYAEQAADIMIAAMQENAFDLIILDSIAAMTPSTELEESSEKWQMGLGARVCNKFFRAVPSTINALTQAGKEPPILMCMNQFRLDLGVKFGDPRILPMGKSQEFAGSVIVYMKSTTIEDDAKENESATVQISGLCRKNKTYLPKLNFTFKMGLRDGEELKKGEIDNLTQMMRAVKRCGLMVKPKTKTILMGEEFKTQKEIKERLASDDAFRDAVWTAIVNTTLGAKNKTAVMADGDDDDAGE